MKIGSGRGLTDFHLYTWQMYLIYHNADSYSHAELLTSNNFPTRWHSFSMALNPLYLVSEA